MPNAHIVESGSGITRVQQAGVDVGSDIDAVDYRMGATLTPDVSDPRLVHVDIAGGGGGGGNVTGPGSSTVGDIATFNNVGGTLLADSSVPVTNVPTAGQKAALAGTNGTPGGGNPYVTSSDPAQTNARAPTAHATTHVTGGTDVIANAVASGNAGLLSGADKAKLDGIGAGANVTSVAGKTGVVTLVPGDVPGTEQTANKGAASGYASLDGATKIPIAQVPTGQTGVTVPFGNDARFTDARTPTAHATTHVTGGSDVIANAVASGNAGLLSGADKAKLDGIGAGANVTSVAGKTGVVTLDHTTDLANIGTNSHAQIDTFIASKAAASGLASLDASSRVVQGASNKIPAAVNVTTTQTLGTSQPLSLTDATMTGLTAGGSLSGTGTVGVVAPSLSSSGAETGSGAGQAGLGANTPFADAAFAGQRGVRVDINKVSGDDLLVVDILALPPSTDLLSPVYGYLSFRSDLGVDAKWRLWFYYKRKSDGVEVAVTPTISIANASIYVTVVYFQADVPLASYLNALVAGDRASELGPQSITGSQLVNNTVTATQVSTAVAGDLVAVDAAAASAGTGTTIPRGDHKHTVSTGSPSVTVKSENTAASTGSASTVLRTDAQIQVATASPTTTVKSEATAAAQGSSNSVIRADAQLQAATAAPGTNVQSDAASAAQGTSSNLLRADAGLIATTAATSSIGTANAQGTSTSLARADHNHTINTATNPQLAGLGIATGGVANAIAMASAAAPSAPSGTVLQLHNTVLAGVRPTLHVQDVNFDKRVVPRSGRRLASIRPLIAGGSSVTGEAQGYAINTAGTISHPALADTDYGTRQCRTRYTSATANNSFGGCGHPPAAGNGTVQNNAGFEITIRFRFNNGAQANNNAFVGLHDSNNAVNDPTTHTNALGVGWVNADVAGNLFLIQTTSGGTLTKTDLGSNAPRDSSTVFELTLFCYPAGSYGFRLVNKSTNTVVSDQTMSGNLPTAAAFLVLDAYVQAGTSAVAAVIDIIFTDEIFY